MTTTVAPVLQCQRILRYTRATDGSNVYDMSWKGAFTKGEIWCRGTEVYILPTAGVIACPECKKVYPLPDREQDQSYAIRAESIQQAILYIKPEELHDEKLRQWGLEAMTFNKVKDLCHCAVYSDTAHYPAMHWKNREGVLAELEQLDTWAKANNITQEWI